MINRTFSTLTVLTNSIKRNFKEYLPLFFLLPSFRGCSKYGRLLSEVPQIDRVAWWYRYKMIEVSRCSLSPPTPHKAIGQVKMCLRTWYTDENGGHIPYLRLFPFKTWQETVKVLLNLILLTHCFGCSFLRDCAFSENHLLFLSASVFSPPESPMLTFPQISFYLREIEMVM